MSIEKEKNLFDYLRKISPGCFIRNALDDILKAGLGALIILETPDLYSKNMFEGGFKLNTILTAQKIFELSKMDGAIIISDDFKRIIYANTLITPDNSIHTDETGTRHKAADRCAKQANTFVISVSERRKKITIYFSDNKYELRNMDELLRDTSLNLQMLEKQYELFNEYLNKLNILEVSNMVSSIDVCKVIQRAEMILKISDILKKQLLECGREASVLNLRYRELIKGIDKKEIDILKDYSNLNPQKAKKILDSFSFEGLTDIDAVSRLVFEKDSNEIIYPKGYRFLSHLNLCEKEINLIIKEFVNLKEIINGSDKEFEEIIQNKSLNLKYQIINLIDQVLSEKIIL